MTDISKGWNCRIILIFKNIKEEKIDVKAEILGFKKELCVKHKYAISEAPK